MEGRAVACGSVGVEPAVHQLFEAHPEFTLGACVECDQGREARTGEVASTWDEPDMGVVEGLASVGAEVDAEVEVDTKAVTPDEPEQIRQEL